MEQHRHTPVAAELLPGRGKRIIVLLLVALVVSGLMALLPPAVAHGQAAWAGTPADGTAPTMKLLHWSPSAM